jgi:hypothetical protein
METRFMVDMNVGRLARWLRLMGYDARLFDGQDDNQMIRMALAEGRVLLTKDTQIMKRWVVTSGRLKVLLIQGEDHREQLRQVASSLGLDYRYRPFSLCLECNRPLEPRGKEEVRGLVPAYVFRTQSEFTQCPACHRVYWRGTHWQSMSRELERFISGARA